MISGCENIDVCGTRIASPAFAPDPEYKGYSVIRRPVLFFSIGGGKALEEVAEMIESHWDGIAAYCRPKNKVALGFVEGLNNKIRVIQRRS